MEKNHAVLSDSLKPEKVFSFETSLLTKSSKDILNIFVCKNFTFF